MIVLSGPVSFPFGSRRAVALAFRHAPLATVLALILAATLCSPSEAADPDFSLSYFVPQTGPLATPTEGWSAYRNFRFCPNNDGGTSLPFNARIKIVIHDETGGGISGITSDQICILFNGGTPAQGFAGAGADSIIANSFWNPSPLCPDVRCVAADAPTNADGITYITFGGADPAAPGVWVRDPNRKWGHYDSELPVFVMGSKLYGRETTASVHGSYTLRIKNMDHVGGLGTVKDAGAFVSSLDYNSVVWGLDASVDPTTYWRDFNDDGTITLIDYNILYVHKLHDCDTPNAP